MWLRRISDQHPASMKHSGCSASIRGGGKWRRPSVPFGPEARLCRDPFADDADALFAMHYNFVRIHKTLRTTPAMAAGVTSRLWEIGDNVDVLKSWECSK
jgi:hypothetical protein